jgi:hypothetical protein
LAGAVAIAAAVVILALARQVVGNSEPQALSLGGPTPVPEAARLLPCGPRFRFAGAVYQVRSMTPFPPGETLGRVRVQDCHDKGRKVVATVHAFRGVDPHLAVGVRNQMTVLALSESRCLGLVDERLIACLRGS